MIQNRFHYLRNHFSAVLQFILRLEVGCLYRGLLSLVIPSLQRGAAWKQVRWFWNFSFQSLPLTFAMDRGPHAGELRDLRYTNKNSTLPILS